MNSYPFGLIMDNKKVMDCVILVKPDSVRFMFEEPIVFYKGKDKGTNFEITDTQVKNPYGYVVDRIKRIVDRNPHIVGVMIDGEELLVTDNYITPERTSTKLIVEGVVIPQGSKLVQQVVSKAGKVLVKKEHSYKDMGKGGKQLELSTKTVEVPTKKDDEGFPRYTRNPYINRALFEAGVPSGDDSKRFSVYLSSKGEVLKALALAARKLGMSQVSSRTIYRVCSQSASNMRRHGDVFINSALRKDKLSLDTGEHLLKEHYWFTVSSILDYENAH